MPLIILGFLLLLLALGFYFYYRLSSTDYQTKRFDDVLKETVPKQQNFAPFDPVLTPERRGTGDMPMI